MTTLSVGARVWNGAAIIDAAGAKVTTGTVPIQYILDDAGTPKYLQDDLATISTTPNTIDIPYVGAVGAHAHLLTIPESMRGLRGEILVQDSSGLEYREAFLVASSGTVTGAGNLLIVAD